MKSLLKLFEKFSNFIYALFFTRDDDLDVLQLLFTVIVIVTLLVTWKVTTLAGMNDTVRVEGLITLRWLTGLLVITAVPKWLVPFVIQAKSNLTDISSPSQVTQQTTITEEAVSEEPNVQTRTD